MSSESQPFFFFLIIQWWPNYFKNSSKVKRKDNKIMDQFWVWGIRQREEDFICRNKTQRYSVCLSNPHPTPVNKAIEGPKNAWMVVAFFLPLSVCLSVTSCPSCYHSVCRSLSLSLSLRSRSPLPLSVYPSESIPYVVPCLSSTPTHLCRSLLWSFFFLLTYQFPFVSLAMPPAILSVFLCDKALNFTWLPHSSPPSFSPLC